MLMPVSYIVRTTMSNEIVLVPTSIWARFAESMARLAATALRSMQGHKAADGVARQAQMVLHGDLGSVFDLLNGELHQLAHRGGRHGAGRADLRLTAALRAGDGRVAADQIADDARHAQRVGHAQVGIVVFAL